MLISKFWRDDVIGLFWGMVLGYTLHCLALVVWRINYHTLLTLPYIPYHAITHHTIQHPYIRYDTTLPPGEPGPPDRLGGVRQGGPGQELHPGQGGARDPCRCLTHTRQPQYTSTKTSPWWLFSCPVMKCFGVFSLVMQCCENKGKFIAH